MQQSGDAAKAARGLATGGVLCGGLQQLLRQLQHAFAHDAGAQQDGQQLRIGQRGGPARQELFARRKLRHEDQLFEPCPRGVGGDGIAHVARRDGCQGLLAHLLRHEHTGQRAAVLETPGGILGLVLEQQALDAAERGEPRPRFCQRGAALAQRGARIHLLEREELRKPLPQAEAGPRPRPLDAGQGNLQRFAVPGEFLQLLEGIFEAGEGGDEFPHGRRFRVLPPS